MKISVVLCTHNRSQSLSKALDSVAASTLPGSVDWEVLVVDNNSSDQTRAVVEEFSGRYPGRFRYAFEPQPGKSYALNTGIHESRGDVLAFMDDDVIVEPTWLRNLTASLHNGEWAGAGGRILPQQNFSPPRWLALDGPYGLGSMLYAHFDLGDKAGELDRAPFGTNMAFQKKIFEKYGGFRTDMGPCPGSEIRNEDTELGRRLMAAGERLRYEPLAVVYHVVQENRVRKEFFLSFWFEHGRSVIREVGPRPDIWGIPRCYFSIPKGIGLTLLAALRWMLALNPQRRFHLKGLVWYFAGQIVEIYHQSFDTNRPTDHGREEIKAASDARK
jgi:glycosyltransferase involved in cell wall biosynthesis